MNVEFRVNWNFPYTEAFHLPGLVCFLYDDSSAGKLVLFAIQPEAKNTLYRIVDLGSERSR